MTHTPDDLYAKCLAFVEEQSRGEWGDIMVRTDARKLEVFVLAQLAEREGWRPIETAPKDGTKVMAWGPGYEWPEVVYWLKYDPDDAREAGQPGCWLYAEELLANVADVLDDQLSHWRPLPDPPSPSVSVRGNAGEGL